MWQSHAEAGAGCRRQVYHYRMSTIRPAFVDLNSADRAVVGILARETPDDDDEDDDLEDEDEDDEEEQDNDEDDGNSDGYSE